LSLVFEVPHQGEKSDPDPHQIKNLNPDPRPHQGDKSNPDPHPDLHQRDAEPQHRIELMEELPSILGSVVDQDFTFPYEVRCRTFLNQVKLSVASSAFLVS
jgi:hypothetical protein